MLFYFVKDTWFRITQQMALVNDS